MGTAVVWDRGVLFAVLLTAIAGLATGLGSCVALLTKKSNFKALSCCLGFSAGVMLFVSLVEIFAKGKSALCEQFGMRQGYAFCILAFFGGIVLILLIDKLIPKPELVEQNAGEGKDNSAHLLRSGMLTALALAIHNFPEGLATFISAMQSIYFAIPIVVAIAIHNIPEGIAVSMPIYFATQSRKKAFWFSFLSGLTEPLGAIVGYFLLIPFMGATTMGLIFCFVSGIMVFICLNDLLPLAHKLGAHHLTIYGVIGGMLVMALSLWLFV